MARFVSDLRDQMTGMGAYKESNAERIHKALDSLSNQRTLDQLKTWRETMKPYLYKHVEGDTSPQFAGPLMERVENFMGQHSPEGVAAMKQADREYSIQKLSEAMNKRFNKAIGQAGAANSGLNTGNKLQQAMVALRDNEKAMRGLSDEEKAFVEKAATATVPEGMLRYVAHLFGGGGGLGALATGLGVGAIHGPATGGATTALGLGAKVLHNEIKKDQANRFRDMILERSQYVPGRPPPTGLQKFLQAQPVTAPSLIGMQMNSPTSFNSGYTAQ